MVPARDTSFPNRGGPVMRSFALLGLVLVLCLVFDPAPVLAQGEGQFAVAINLAGRQRMLSQKAAKEALQVVLGLEADQSKEELKKTMELFEKTLTGLAHGDAGLGLAAPSAAVGAEVTKAEPLWQDYKQVLNDAAAGKADVDRLARASADVLSQMQVLVRALRTESKAATGSAWGEVMGQAGVQRMRSQEMTKQIYLIALKKDVDTQRQALKLASEQFDRTLKGLVLGDADLKLPPCTDAKVRTQCDVVGKVWGEFSGLVGRVVKGEELKPEDLKKVAALNLDLLAESDRVVKLFETLASGK